MTHYELTYIVRPDVPTTSVDLVASKVADLVKKHKGKVAKTEQWGLRSLSYPIKKHRKGYYTMMGVSLATGSNVAINDIEYQLKLSEDVIRFLTVKVEEISKEPSVMLKAKNRMNGEDGDASSAPASV